MIKKLGNLTLVSDVGDADIIMVGRNAEGDGTNPIPDNLSKSNDLEKISLLKGVEKQLQLMLRFQVKNTRN